MIMRVSFENIYSVSRIFDNEDESSYFPGMFENPALQRNMILKKLNQKYYEILTIYKCVEK